MADPLRALRDARTRAEVLAAAADADRLLARAARSRPDLADRIGRWRRELAGIPEAVTGARARIAFVGAVKSGKSTLVNALLGDDLLPRGSGILTAQVAEIRRADRPAVHLAWKSRDEVNAALRFHLDGLGRPGRWDLWHPDHRAAARDAASTGGPNPHRKAVAALLDGFDELGPRIGPEPRTEDLPGTRDLWAWVARDAVTGFLAGLRVDAPAPDLPDRVALVDCPGADAWNAAHGRLVDEAVLSSHALVYVVSSRVGLREADVRFLQALQGYGLLPVTRFVVNVDLGELRNREDLERVLGTVRDGLAQAGITARPVALSALMGLLDRVALVAPDRIPAGERRLLEAWESAGGGLAPGLRDAFTAFRAALWDEARTEGDRLVLSRARADLRRTLVAARAALGPAAADLDGAAWRADTADALLAWLQQRMERAAAAEKDRIRGEMARAFRGRRAPHRRAWSGRVEAVDPAEAGPWMWDRAETALAATEPLRVNAVRNLALSARGGLARAGEEAGREAAAALGRAGVAPGAPPDRAALAREITATRRIPLFRGRAQAAAQETERGGAAGRLGRLWERLRPGDGGRAAQAAEATGAAARRAVLLHRLARVWIAYLDEVEHACLAPHVDEAAAQVYDCLAAWVLEQVAGPGRR